MRFVPTFCLREGMILANNLYGKKGEFMLVNGTVLTNAYIESINKLKYNGIYISDDLSKDIEIVNVIEDHLRLETIKGIKNIFISSENKDMSYKKIDLLKKQVENIIDELISNKHLMVNMIDLKIFDDYTYFHSVNVAILSVVLGVALNLNRKALCELGLGALLHDIGKVFIIKELLNKPDKLTTEEFETIKSHPFLGYEYIKKEFNIPIKSYIAIMDHHEKYNGEGYPNGKALNKISLYGQIISVADVYDALVSNRPYRDALVPSEAMEYIMGGSGTLFDPELVNLFTRKVSPYPIGTCVNLSNNEIGIVLANYEDCCIRPKLRVFQRNNKAISPYIADLKNDSTLSNVTIIGIAKI